MLRSIDSIKGNTLPVGQDIQPEFGALPLKPWPAQWRPSVDFPTPLSGTPMLEQSDTQYRLGDPTLPIAPYRQHILDTVFDNQAVVLSSQTGSGKSTQLGLYLLEAGYPRVFVSSPRILAARDLKARAEFSLGEEYADLAGYLTGNAEDSDCGPNARLIYVTEQLLCKMVNRGQLNADDVIINDEAHERTPGTIILLGLVKELLPGNPDMKLVISSATIDTKKFSHYLPDSRTLRPAPVLSLPGRTYPIENEVSGMSVGAAVRDYMKAGHNVLAFEPGLTRLRKTWAKAQSRTNGDTVHLLYGDQSPREQRDALTAEDHHHTIATRVGETSLTPEGKDVVVDSGLSNLGGYHQGVTTLATVFSSQATMDQRKGRVGRTHPGIYVEAVPDDAPPPPSYDQRDEYDPPSMESSSLAPYILELLLGGRRLEDLSLLEAPAAENLRHDYKMLERISAIMTRREVTGVTDIGWRMADLPLDSHLARMVVEARLLAESGEYPDDSLRLQVAGVAAIQQVKGILNSWNYSKRRYMLSRRSEEILSREQTSDVLFELDVFTNIYAKHQLLAAEQGLSVDEVNIDALLNSRDIFPNRYYKALRTFRELCRREGLDPDGLQLADRIQRRAIIDCQISGALELFVQKGRSVHQDIRGERRHLGRRSTIAAPLAGLVIGTAFDLHGLRQTGAYRRMFINGASAVSVDQLLKKAGSRITRDKVRHGINSNGEITELHALYFDGLLPFGEVEAKPAPTLETREFLLTAMMTGLAPSVQDPNRLDPFVPNTPRAARAIARYEQARQLDDSSVVKLNVTKRHQALVRRVIRDSLDKLPLDVTDLDQLDALIPEVYVNALVRPTRKKDIPSIIQMAPDGISLHTENEEKVYVPVVYRKGIAYVTITRDMQYSIRRQDFADLERHGVKIRVSKKQYLPIDAAFENMEELRNSPARLRRLERRAQLAERPITLEQDKPVKIPKGRALIHPDMAPMTSAPIKKKGQVRRKNSPVRRSHSKEPKEAVK